MARRSKNQGATEVTVLPTPQASGIRIPPISPISIDLVSDLLSNPDLTPSERRRIAFERAGLKGTKSKYATPEARKAAQKARSKARREARIQALPEALRPQARMKRSPEEKKEKRKERSKMKREFLREFAKEHPETAAKYGIHVELFKENRRPKKEKKAKKKK